MLNLKELFITENNAGIRIFLDMDGVLVNWNKGYLAKVAKVDPEVFNTVSFDPKTESPFQLEQKLFDYYKKQGHPEKRAKGISKSRFWKPVHGDIEFWKNLEWMPDGKQLFDYCYNLKKEDKIKELNILSSPSSDPVCQIGKRHWLDKHNLTDKFDRVIIMKDKYKNAAGVTDILIDDTNKKLVDWEVLGNGTPILHTSTKSTLKILDSIFN